MSLYPALRAGFPLDRPFLTMPDGRRWSYGEIDALSAHMAGALATAGANPGDRLCVQVDKSAENVALYLAALRAGLVYTPLNTAYTADEVAYFLADAKPSLFICRPESIGTLGAVAANAGARILTLGRSGEGTLLDADAAPHAPITRGDQDLAAILYTSGTTGRSKGAMLTNRNLLSNAAALHRLWGFREGDVLLHALPIFHIHGLFVALHTAMLNGSEVLFHPGFDAAAVRRDLPRATVMMGVPTFYSRLLADPDFKADDCRGVRLFISGSAPLTVETFNAFEARTGHRILERYGMSEAGMIASNPLDGARVAGTVGFALPYVRIRITGESGAPLPSGETGDVEVRGENVFAGYWRQPEKTKAEFRDGWFRTGDVGALDAEGRLTLAGRSKDLIIAGGYNIYPVEIEQLLDALDGVGESAVIGVPHADMGEGVVAVLTPPLSGVRASDADLSAAMEKLAKFKRPRRFIWVESLPRNAMGKVQKQVLRAAHKDAFSPQ
jgi:malonyl-CoA/methylmalonyl-CoA synthetase